MRLFDPFLQATYRPCFWYFCPTRGVTFSSNSSFRYSKSPANNQSYFAMELIILTLPNFLKLNFVININSFIHQSQTKIYRQVDVIIINAFPLLRHDKAIRFHINCNTCYNLVNCQSQILSYRTRNVLQALSEIFIIQHVCKEYRL